MLSVFTKKSSIKIDGKINFYSSSVDCGFKWFETIDKEELNDLLKVLVWLLKGSM